MDGVQETPVDPTTAVEESLLGLDMEQTLNALLVKTPSSDPGLAMFELSLTTLEKISAYFGQAFDRSEYWGSDKITGSWPALPDFVKPIVVPEVITEESIIAFATLSRDLYSMAQEHRSTIERTTRNQRGSNGMVNPQLLDRNLQTAPMYIAALHSTSSDEDDFL